MGQFWNVHYSPVCLEPARGDPGDRHQISWERGTGILISLSNTDSEEFVSQEPTVSVRGKTDDSQILFSFLSARFLGGSVTTTRSSESRSSSRSANTVITGKISLMA